MDIGGNAVVLALISGLLHALWNAGAKKLSAVPSGQNHGQIDGQIGARARVTTPLLLALAVPYTLGIALLVGLPLQISLNGSHATAGLWWTLLAGVGEAVYVFSLARAYAAGDLAVTYAVCRASAMVFVWPLSALAFNSFPSDRALFATLVIGVGIVTLQLGSKTKSNLHLGWTLLSGLAVGIYHTGYKGSLLVGVSPAASFSIAASTAAFAILAPMVLAPSASAKATRAACRDLARSPMFWLAGVGVCGSFLLMLVALTSASSGPILAVRNSSVAFAALLATWMGERLNTRQWAGIATLLAGVWLMPPH